MYTRTVVYEMNPQDRDVCSHIARAECEIMQAAQIINRLGGATMVEKAKLDKAYGILADLVPVNYIHLDLSD